MEGPAEERYVPVEEIAEKLGLPLSVLLRRVEAGDVPSRRIDTDSGPHYALRLSDLGIEPDEPDEPSDAGGINSFDRGAEAAPESVDAEHEILQPAWSTRPLEPRQPPVWITAAPRPESGAPAEPIGHDEPGHAHPDPSEEHPDPSEIDVEDGSSMSAAEPAPAEHEAGQLAAWEPADWHRRAEDPAVAHPAAQEAAAEHVAAAAWEPAAEHPEDEPEEPAAAPWEPPAAHRAPAWEPPAEEGVTTEPEEPEVAAEPMAAEPAAFQLATAEPQPAPVVASEPAQEPAPAPTPTAEPALHALSAPEPARAPASNLMDPLGGPRTDLASMSLDARDLVAGLLDRWERTLEQRIYTEQRQRFQVELSARQSMVRELQMELQTARAEHAAAQAEKDRLLAAKERELADRERDLAETRRYVEEAERSGPSSEQPRRRWFRPRGDD